MATGLASARKIDRGTAPALWGMQSLCGFAHRNAHDVNAQRVLARVSFAADASTVGRESARLRAPHPGRPRRARDRWWLRDRARDGARDGAARREGRDLRPYPREARARGGADRPGVVARARARDDV